MTTPAVSPLHRRAKGSKNCNNVPLVAPTLKVSPPTGPVKPGRGFYQLEEDALYVAVAGYPDPAKFFSYLESDTVRFDLDTKARLMTLEVTLPRRQWPVDRVMTYPMRATPADIRWIDFRQMMTEPKLFTDQKRLNLMIRFSENKPAASHYLADKLFCQIDADQQLIAIWVTDIIDDLAGQELSAFRKLHRSA